jgi:hypothetical protein
VASVILACVSTWVLATGAPPALAVKSPEEWDPRVAAIAKQVERLRGIEFDEPVPVKVLDSATFDKRYARGQKPTTKGRKEWAESEAALRALGLLDRPVPLEALTAGVGAQVLGFYDPADKAIVVRGDTFSSPETRSTLAHELTHALQDQEFDLGRMDRRERAADASSVSALIEGDATRIGETYTSGLSASQQAEIDASNSSTVATAPDLPPFVTVSFASEYALGYMMTTALEAAGGDKAIDDAFRNPPLNDLAIIDPVALLDATLAIKVKAPQLAAGDVALGDPTVLGAATLYFMLASHLPPADALAVAQRWGGDSSIAFTRGGSTPCVTSVMVGRDGTADTAALQAGLERWNVASRTNAEIARQGKRLTLTSCEPSNPEPVSEAALSQALFHVLLRNSFAAGALGSTSPRTATCIADGIMALDSLTGTLATVQTPDDDLPADWDTTVTADVRANAPRLRAQCQGKG